MTKNSKDVRQAQAQKECDYLIQDIDEHKHFKAQVQSKKIAWNKKPTSEIVGIDAEIDNTLRNYGYHENISGSRVLNQLLKTKLQPFIEVLKDEYPQRPFDADWRAYRWHIHNKKLTKTQKKNDIVTKVKFNATYGRNNPCYDCAIWPEEKLA